MFSIKDIHCPVEFINQLGISPFCLFILAACPFIMNNSRFAEVDYLPSGLLYPSIVVFLTSIKAPVRQSIS